MTIESPDDSSIESASEERRLVLRAESAAAARYWGGFQLRIVLTFAVFAAAWITVIVLGVTGALPLWAGLIINTVLASMFYMPMHEATHKNIWGQNSTARWGEDLIGKACSIPTGISYTSHRPGHMRHHAFTNDPNRDPDHFTEGPLRELPAKWVRLVMLNTFLPLFALVPSMRRFIPAKVLKSGTGDRKDGIVQFRFWAVTTLALIVAFATGFGWQAVLLWWLPGRLQMMWLLFIFAWYPHHPASEVGRYVDTRVAVFPGSRFLIRGHDHHALHHLFPRVPHYHLRSLWNDVAADMVAKGVRAEGRALESTGKIVW